MCRAATLATVCVIVVAIMFSIAMGASLSIAPRSDLKIKQLELPPPENAPQAKHMETFAASSSDICVLMLSCIKTCQRDSADEALRVRKCKRSFAFWAERGHSIVSVDSSNFDLATVMPPAVNACTRYFRFSQPCPMDSTTGEQLALAFVLRTPACLSILESSAITAKVTPWYMFDLPPLPLSLSLSLPSSLPSQHNRVSRVDLCVQRSENADYIHTETYAVSSWALRGLFQHLATAEKRGGRQYMEHFMGDFVKAEAAKRSERSDAAPLMIRQFRPLPLHVPVLARGYSTVLRSL